MALQKCDECGNKVSSKAKACPQCGAPIKQEGSAGAGCLSLFIIILFVVGLAWIVPKIDSDRSGGSFNSPSSLSSHSVEPRTGGRAASDIQHSPLSSSSSASSRDKWYVGGTLHKATMAEWNRASYRDRLATCGDFIAAIMNKDGKKMSSMDQLLSEAVALESCITEAGRGGHADTQPVATISAACHILMEQ